MVSFPKSKPTPPPGYPGVPLLHARTFPRLDKKDPGPRDGDPPRLGGPLVAAMDRAWREEAGNSLSPTPHHDLTWVWGKGRSLVGSQRIQGRVSTDLFARCSKAPRPSPAPFAWRRGGPRLQSSGSQGTGGGRGGLAARDAPLPLPLRTPPALAGRRPIAGTGPQLEPITPPAPLGTSRLISDPL